MRIALGISYDGSTYAGWQSQPSGNTVQDQMEAALAQFTGSPHRIMCAGRTDAGVHALMQVAHLDTMLDRPMHSWVRGLNTYLPASIAVQWACPVPDAFHARASAESRRYSYIVLQSPVRPSVEHGKAGWSMYALDGERMKEAATALVGRHDFTSFRASSCQALSPVKTMLAVDVHQRGAYWRFDFEADAFLHHMIRNIVGCLVLIGQGRQPAAWMSQVLAARDRDAAAPTFSPDGLYFVGPRYSADWGLPQSVPGLDWLP